MNITRKHLLLGLGVAGLLAAPRAASAEASYTLRKAYTGTAGGNSYVDAGYRIEYGLAAGKIGSVATVGGDARASAWVKLFGKQFEAASVKAVHNGSMTTTCNANLQYETYMVGIKIPGASGSVGGGTWTPTSKAVSSRIQQLTPTVSVDFVRLGPAALGFDVTTTATAYTRLDGTIWCNQVSATFKPGLFATIKAQFRADVLIASAGIRGTLNLMDSALPMTGRATWGTKTASDFFSGGTFCTWQLNTQATANLEIVPVSGKFEAYVRVGPPCTNLFGLLSGKGICFNEEWTQTFWNFTGAKKVWPLAGTPAEIRLGDNTATCGPSIPSPTTRS